MNAGVKRRILRGVLTGVGLAVLLVAGLGLWVYGINREDDALDPRVSQALAEPATATLKSTEVDEGLLLLIGLHAADGADPIRFGRDWLKSAAAPPPDGEPRPDLPKIAGRDWPILAVEQAYAHFTTGAQIFQQRLEASGELHKRFHLLMQRESFDDAHLPMSGLPRNLYVPWLRAHQLELGLAVGAIRGGRIEEGLTSIERLAEHGRKVMLGSRTLSGKRAAVTAQARLALLLSQLMNDEPKLVRNHMNKIESILQPTVNAQDFRPAQAHETREMLVRLRRFTSEAGREEIEVRSLDGLLMRHLTLSNATLNMVAPTIQPAMKHANSSAFLGDGALRDLRAAQRSLYAATDIDGAGKIRNIGGRTLLSFVWWPAVPEAKNRALDLDNLLMLIRAQGYLQLSAVPPEDREAFLRDTKISVLFPPGFLPSVSYNAAKLELQMPSSAGVRDKITVKLPAA